MKRQFEKGDIVQHFKREMSRCCVLVQEFSDAHIGYKINKKNAREHKIRWKKYNLKTKKGKTP